jgi:hemerythrin
MYSINYPEYETHKHHHEKLLEIYNQKVMEIELGEQTIDDFLAFLLDWFVSHTINEDKKIATYVQGKTI